MRPDLVAELLRHADDFVGVARVVVEHAPLWFDLSLCGVTLLSREGRPAILVDNGAALSDAVRERYVDGALAADPLYPLVAETRAPVVADDVLAHPTYILLLRRLGYSGPELHFMLLPILDPEGLLGTIHCGRRREYTPAVRRDASVLAAHVSVRLTQLGITAANELGILSTRQHEVAQLAGRGLANHEIADSLGVSENTIKKHLKDVFARLGVANRTELATRLAHAARRVDPPHGISRAGSVVITRGLP